MARTSLALVIGSLLCASQAQAFCRATTLEPSAEASVGESCPEHGVPLSWQKRTLSYSFQPELASSDLDEATVRTIFEEAFAKWEQIDCGDEPFSVHPSPEPAVERTANYVQGSSSNLNAIMFQSAETWAALGYGSGAYALTTSVFEAKTGRIVGTDMEINEGLGPYMVCPERGCPEFSEGTDLPNVVTHEVGHFLGLAHSPEPESTMYFHADPWQTNKRSLELDDENGMCELLADMPDSPKKLPPITGGCSLTKGRAVDSRTGDALLLLLGLWVVRKKMLLRRA